MTIIEAPAPEVLCHNGDQQHYRSFREMSEAYIGAFESGDTGAIALMIDFFGGTGTFAGWPERVRDYARQTTAVNILDWRTAYGFPLSAMTLATIEVPTLVLCGSESHRAMRRANERIAEGIPNASSITLAGAAHFMISTHPKEVAGMIVAHVAGAKLGAPKSLRRSASSAQGDQAFSQLLEQALQLPATFDRSSRT